MNIVNSVMSYFGTRPPRPFRDFDLLHEPSATVTHLPVRPADSSPRPGSPGVGGPAAPALSPGAAGIHPSQIPGIHPSQIPVDWREQLGWAHQVLSRVLADHDAGVIDLNRRR